MWEQLHFSSLLTLAHLGSHIWTPSTVLRASLFGLCGEFKAKTVKIKWNALIQNALKKGFCQVK